MARKKSDLEHKIPITVTLEPLHEKTIKERYRDWGYRNVSHLVDDAISILIKNKTGGANDSTKD